MSTRFAFLRLESRTRIGDTAEGEPEYASTSTLVNLDHVLEVRPADDDGVVRLHLSDGRTVMALATLDDLQTVIGSIGAGE